MRGDFDLRPSLRARVGLVTQELLRLTREQYRVLDGLADNQRVVIRGGAGTGKTLLAVEEARRAAADGRRVLFCCYNKNLGLFLKEAMADQPLITVGHLHGLMRALVDEAKMAERLPNADTSDLMAVFLPDLAAESLIELGRAEVYDFLVLDEAQDLLRDKYLEVLSLLLKNGLENGRWRFFLDPRQNVFKAIHPKTMERLLSLAPAQYMLSLNCRNTLPIAVATSVLSGFESDETLVVDGPAVDQFWYSDTSDERRMISRHLNRILSERIKPQDVVILSHRVLANSSLSEGLAGAVYELRDMTDGARWPDKEIRFSTISGYKGLEADVVFIIDVDDLNDDSRLETLYVGASRARACLSVFLSQKVRETYEIHAQEFGRRLGETSSPSVSAS
jgi:superfamily I DNA and RNA helicase